ncbi:alpha/beta hydrolase [Actinomadura sp. ATCC 31491]|uniref:Alpha/beta hydrolase n=1 Tax=Actinomadura luzonensis TaxID=2805427 RepID=A0ABT0FVI5_9ACTN|nr:alpha/beta hydrolase [Actinomadura luzonensis]MCK2216325.1 alpha/beta hydrolase [Actinomadura luzonensis]
MITTLDHVTSRDGTTIAYRRLGGDGPGLVLLHGAMQTGHGNIELAEALSADFTCYVPDRRGRGRSGPAGPRYGLAREVEDLTALLAATGAEHVAGVSSGAIIALRTALALGAVPGGPAVRKIVAFEPPLDLDGSNPTGWLARFDREIAAGRVPAALVTGMRATRMGPAVFTVVPRFLLEAMTAAMLKNQDKVAVAGEPTFRALAPTLRQDAQLVAETADDLAAYRALTAEVLLLGGTRSPAYLRDALTALQGVLPRCRRADLPGLDHSATSNAAMRGRPARVAAEIRRFLLSAG